MSGNTIRGTPTRNQGRGNLPFTNSPAGSGIPRPSHEQPSEVSSSVSASRQKQSKRDEVRLCRSHRRFAALPLDYFCFLLRCSQARRLGHSQKDGE